MAVTKQVYSQAATWTAVQFASLLRQAFIDAGYMTDWYDSFTASGHEQRVLEVVYDPTKTYGKTYYWFTMTSSSTSYGIRVCTGWNAITHLPTGTVYLDYWSSTTNNVNHSSRLIESMSFTTALSITRFTSQVDSSHSFFLIKNGGLWHTFTIARPSHQIVSWIDLDKNLFSHYIELWPIINTYGAKMAFESRALTRRCYGASGYLNGYTDQNTVNYFTWRTASYGIPGRASNSESSNGDTGIDVGGLKSQSVSFNILLPNALSSSNPAYAADYNPVVSGVPYSFYMTNSNLPSDFAIIPHYANNTLAIGDTFVVTAGVEEYEIISAANNGTANTGASIAFGARII